LRFRHAALVALVGGQAKYSVGRGSGWRGDCFGDYGVFGYGWNHMEDLYEGTAQDPIIGAAWKTAPVQFEVCGVMQDWFELGFDIDTILAKGLEWHMSVLNAKSSPVPADWRPQVDEFLKKVGYRIVLVQMTHTSEASAGASLLLDSTWENRAAPIYRHGRRLSAARRLGSVLASWVSTPSKLLPERTKHKHRGGAEDIRRATTRWIWRSR
jgi:hypothetical protein